MIHVSGAWYNAFISAQTEVVELDITHFGATCVLNVISKFAVPCFIMLSGAFILDNERNYDYKYFYKKTFKSVGIPTIIFSIFYLVYRITKAVLVLIVKNKDISTIIEPIVEFLKGEPCYHMWYLYMMIGVYCMVPWIFIL